LVSIFSEKLLDFSHLGEVGRTGIGAVHKTKKNCCDFSGKACRVCGLALEIGQTIALAPGRAADIHGVKFCWLLTAGR